MTAATCTRQSGRRQLPATGQLSRAALCALEQTIHAARPVAAATAGWVLRGGSGSSIAPFGEAPQPTGTAGHPPSKEPHSWLCNDIYHRSNSTRERGALKKRFAAAATS